MTELTASDLSSLMMDLHFERETVNRNDPSAVADVIRNQLYQVRVGRTLSSDRAVIAADAFHLEAEELRVAAEYSKVVDNHDGSASTETNLNNFAGLVVDDPSGRSKQKRCKSAALDAVRGIFKDDKARQRWSFLDDF